MNKKNLVVKSNKLNEARYKLSIQEQRIILSMISQIKPKDEDFKAYNFSVKEFMSLCGLSGNSAYGHLKKITASLRDKGFTIHELDGDLQIGWLDSVKYYDNEGRFELSFSPKLKPYLFYLKKEFTRYQLHNVIKLKSIYSIRIYELLKQYQMIGHRVFDLVDLRTVLSIPDNSLKRYTDIRRRVLDIAKKELKNSDIIFDYEPVKKGRKVVSVMFSIYKNDTVVKKSKKKTNQEKKVVKEKQLFRDLKNKKQARLKTVLKELEVRYPHLFKILEKQAKKRLTKQQLNNYGLKMTIRLKMESLLPGFMQKNNLKLL